MSIKEPLISIVYWNKQPGELMLVQGNALENLGYSHQFFRYDEKIPDKTDIILMQGPYQPIMPLIKQLVSKQNNRRPVLIYWFQQSMHFIEPEILHNIFTKTFSDLHRQFNDTNLPGKVLDKLAPDLVRRKGRRLSFEGDIVWLHRHRLLDVLALSSDYYAEYFAKFGIHTIVIPRGWVSSYGTNLNITRDITALWMGKTRTRRRRNAVYWLQDQLRKQGLNMLIFDGVQNNFIYGNQRTELLNRTKFVINLYFNDARDELSIRYFIAGANGAVVLTEPSIHQYPFIPGVHVVECPIHKMPEVITYYDNHTDEWQKISANMSSLLHNKLTLENSLKVIMDRAITILKSR